MLVMSLRRTAFRVFLSTAMLTGALAACTSTEAPAAGIRWEPCAENGAYDCAAVPVPIDWAQRDGATIDIAVVRDRADDPARSIGTLISLPGGPGDSGVDQILRGSRFSAELRSRFDIVSLDPRGVKRSHPVRCDAGLADRPNMVPDSGGRLDEIHSYARALAASCRQHTGPLIDHLDAVSVARDIDAVRAALGDDRISIYGRSYGTLAGQAFAELFPQRLRAMALDSVDDHALDGPDFLAGEARAAQDSFGEFASWCARDELCALHGTDLDRAYGRLVAAAGRGELQNPRMPGKPFGPLELSWLVTRRLYNPDWPELATDLQTLTNQPPDRPAPAAPPQQLGEAAPMPEIFVCSDWRFRILDQDQWARLWREQNDNAPTLRAHFAWGVAALCSGWPTGPQNPPHRPQVIDGPPILVMNSRHDPATPHEWAAAVAANTDRATLLTYEGWGHGVYERNSCTTTAADNYLVDLTPAPAGCPAR